jgi:UDP-2,3-diacylglucosamine pyrophosphatase LpxH
MRKWRRIEAGLLRTNGFGHRFLCDGGPGHHGKPFPTFVQHSVSMSNHGIEVKYSELGSLLGDSAKTIVVSDVHLGSEMSDKTAFNSFLSSLADDTDVTDLVLLGDIVDMWRRDASGVFLENMDTIGIIKEFQNRMRVHYVAGNHDYHLRRLKNRAPHYHYPFEFNQTLDLKDGDYTYRFMHGYEFEYGSELRLMKPIMEILCHVLSDTEGVQEDELWAYLARQLSDLHYSVLSHPSEAKGTKIQRIWDSPEVRLKDKLADVERRAHREIADKTQTLLIFGHTHHPFIDQKEKLVNTGSWVKDANPHNTYVELEGGRPRLFVFGGDEIMDRHTIA